MLNSKAINIQSNPIAFELDCFCGMTDERRLLLFPAGTIARDPHHRESPTRREQGLNLRKM